MASETRVEMRIDPLARLIQKLGRLPGIGEKSATRLAFFILRQPESFATELGEALLALRGGVSLCSLCLNITSVDANPCSLCGDPKRDRTQICVVANPPDLVAIERAGHFRGRYHVLHGTLSPLDGVGPDDLKIKELLARIGDREQGIQEIILATSPNVEGEATALYLAKLCRTVGPAGLVISRIASGLAVGGELEYADGLSIARALDGRRAV